MIDFANDHVVHDLEADHSDDEPDAVRRTGPWQPRRPGRSNRVGGRQSRATSNWTSPNSGIGDYDGLSRSKSVRRTGSKGRWRDEIGPHRGNVCLRQRMERPLTAIKNLGTALALITETIEEPAHRR